jgi:uncharacterized protein (DUF58 family)
VIPKELLAALRKIQITTNRLANEQQLAGNYTSVIKGQGLAFSEVRHYQHGDDVRAIDWNVSARMNEPFVKVFVEEREMTVMLLVDLSASQHFGTQGMTKQRLAAEVAALCAFSAVRHGDRVGLVLGTDQVEKLVPPKKGQKHGMRVVREILGAAPSRRSTDLNASLETLLHVARRRTVSFLISDFFTEGYERTLALAAAKHDVIPLVLVDPRDEELVDVGLASFEDFETGETIVVDTSSATVRDHYARAMREARAARVRTFRKLGLDHTIIETHRPYVAPLRALFAQRARRAHR